ncbi:GNAT family N-acetyltransferase [Pseudomonas asuensis]
MSGINRNPSMGNQAWWNNPAPAPASNATDHMTGGTATDSVNYRPVHASTAIQQPATHLPPDRPGQHTAHYSSTQAYLTAVHGAQFGSRSSKSEIKNISSISDSQLRIEAENMYRVVDKLNNPEELEDYLEMLKLICEDEEKSPTLITIPEKNVKISSNGMTVGLMTTSVDMKNKEGTSEEDKKLTLWVDQIVSMPNTRGNGKALIEKALNMSDELGYGGVVRVSVKSGHDFYEHLGFREFPGQVYELDPLKSSDWTKPMESGIFYQSLNRPLTQK